MRITVLSTFDIWPPRDGGQTRYVNLWKNFSRRHEITILVYDFRNTLCERRYRIADHVEVVVPIAADGDVKHFHHMMGRTSLWLHDILCLRDYAFSDEFLRALRQCARSCDVLVASHPYLAGHAFPLAPSGVMKVYESYNVEFDIKAGYLAGSTDQVLARRLLEDVRHDERLAAIQANHVTAVSEADRRRFIELYDLPGDKISVVPNGSDIRSADLLTADERAEARALLKLDDGPVGIFLGSSFMPNVESYRRIRGMLDTGGFRGTVLLVGSIIEASRTDWPAVAFKELWCGFVEAEVRDVLLGAADFALQLMFAGAGTNLKLFDYMGVGVPIIANEFGRRGVDQGDWYWPAETTDELYTAILGVSRDSQLVQKRSVEARRIARNAFDWRSIAVRFEVAMIRGFVHPTTSCIDDHQYNDGALEGFR